MFTLTNLAEGRYFISEVSGLPADAYVADIRQGSRSIYNDGFMTIEKDRPDPLEIVIALNGGTIEWNLVDAQHHPADIGRVFLIPDPPRRLNMLMYKSKTVINVAGTFRMTGIAPGEYKLFAWSSLPEGAEQNEEFIRQYDALGTHVTVNAGMTVANIQVQVIPGNR